MAFDLKDDEKAPVGKSIRDVVGSLKEASKIREPAPQMAPPMHTFTLRSPSSKNKVVQIGSQHVNFDHNGEAKMDARFRQEAEHHCNLVQGFFSIVDSGLPPPVEAFLQNSAGETMQLHLELEMKDLVEVLARVLSNMTTEEKELLCLMEGTDEIQLLVEVVLDRQEAADSRIDGDDLDVTPPQRVFTAEPSTRTAVTLVDPERVAKGQQVDDDDDQEQDPMDMLAAVERGEMAIDETGEVTKVEKRGRGRPPKAKPE